MSINKRLLMSLTAVMLMLTGCTDQHIIERAGFVRTLAYDLSGEGENTKLRVTASIPKSNHEDAIVYTTMAESGKKAKMIFDRQNNRRLVNGQLRQVVFGERLARKGVWSNMDTLTRDPSIGSRLHIIVAESDPHHILIRNDYPQGPTAGEYLDTLIRTEAKSGEIPDTTLYTFTRDYYDDGIDPVATILKEEKDSLSIDGIALFKNDQYVGKIDADDRMFFALLHHGVRAGDLNVSIQTDRNAEEQATLEYLSSKRRIKVLSTRDILEGRPIQVALRIRLSGSLLEYIGALDMKKRTDQRKLEAELEKTINRKCQKLIDHMQEKKSDPMGIGQYVRNSIPHSVWKQLKWEEVFSKADISVHVDVKIRDYGKSLH
ncbi:Ger(x)C family spore germination protein [Paenibacillus cellulositrophicus]|uniref:Ger(x)C family spore germination protein n=1 Tax=Paenibacillus cellulositrophicus TaxID=562959 RepID=UPI00203C3B45|nr:Ger(x)C family spore germination protein [Paenibacillus cellulositrophicus]MCM3000926.1 Ger(x)C family spore germination protein [Paenibacillus cellulositrophicus]